jgi:hypothetical protein
VGVVHGGQIDAWFFHTMVGLLQSSTPDHTLDHHVCIRSGPLLSAGRGTLVNTFLDDTDSEALLMLDSDQHCDPEVVFTLIDLFARLTAERPDIGILCGITYISKDERADVLYPNIWANGRHPGENVQLTVYPKNSLIEIGGAGCSNMIVHRKVLEVFRAEKINPFHHIPILDWDLIATSLADIPPAEQAAYLQKTVWDADQLGEDLSFCRRVRAAGYKILAHTGIIFDHSKNVLLGEREYDAAVKRHTTKEHDE